MVDSLLRNLFIAVSVLLTFSPLTDGHTRVSSSEQLSSVLSEDKDHGTILLDGDVFEVDGLEVQSGGVIKPACGRKPIIIGKCFNANMKLGKEAEKGYWKMNIREFKVGDFYAFDKDMGALPISGFHILGEGDKPLIDSTIIVVDTERMIIKIPLSRKYSFMKNKSVMEMKNCIVKFGCWYRGVDLTDIYTDSGYLYGRSSNRYEFGFIHRYKYLPVAVEVFNYPGTELSPQGCIYIDGYNDVHIPNEVGSAKISTTDNLLRIKGNRRLSIENISFKGADRAVLMSGAANKNFNRCSFSYCGKGIECYNGEANVFCGSSVTNCTFEHLYTAMAVSFKGCDQVVIRDNCINDVGIYTKGWYGAIAASGNDFLIENNTITDFCYCGISVGNSEHPGKEKVVGVVRNNLIDNMANYGHPETQAIDGGGVYVYACIDQLEISNNIVRNIGFDNSWLRGIFLDGGAPNCSVTNNMVYNMYPGEYAMFAPYYDKGYYCTRNNTFEGNIVIGKWYIGSNPIDGNVRLKDNFTTTVPFIQRKDLVVEENNLEIKVIVQQDGAVMIDKGTKVKSRGYSRAIKKMYNNRKRL